MRYHRLGKYRAPKKDELFEAPGYGPTRATADFPITSEHWILRAAPEDGTPEAMYDDVLAALGASKFESMLDAARRVVAERDELRKRVDALERSPVCDFLAEARAVVKAARLTSMRWCDVVVISEDWWNPLTYSINALAAKLPKEAP